MKRYSNKMVIARTPLRVSFFGGGTDFKGYYEQHEGKVVSVTIDKYIYVFVKPNYIDDDIVLNYFEKEKVKDVNEIKHGIIREALKIANITEKVEIISTSDLAYQGTGLGSSSAFTVGLLQALFAYRGEKKDPFELAELASHIEIDILGEPIGKQDQYAAAFGGLKEYVFTRGGTVQVNDIALNNQGYDHLASHMMLFHTGIGRKASSILSDQKNRMSQNIEYLHVLKGMVEESQKYWFNLEIDKIGELLDKAWETKKRLSTKIQNETIEQMYHMGRKEGAYGGKLLGAGGGGYFCFLCPSQHQAALKRRLKSFNYLPVNIELQGSLVMAL